MTRRATLTQAELTRLANAAKASGVRLVARIGGIEVVADPHAPVQPSPVESGGGNTCDDAFGIAR